MNTRLLRLVIFYAIALAGSFAFRFNPPDWYTQLTLPYGLTMVKHLGEGIGPIIGMLVMVYFFRCKFNTSFLGSNSMRSTLYISIPLAGIILVGIENEEELNRHYYGGIAALVSLAYVVFEEAGWRGYLLPEMKHFKLNPWLRSAFIGLLWYVWHLNFTQGAFADHIIFLGVLIFASWGLERIERSVIQRQVFRKAEQHDVAKRKTSNAEFE